MIYTFSWQLFRNLQACIQARSFLIEKKAFEKLSAYHCKWHKDTLLIIGISIMEITELLSKESIYWYILLRNCHMPRALINACNFWLTFWLFFIDLYSKRFIVSLLTLLFICFVQLRWKSYMSGLDLFL